MKVLMASQAFVKRLGGGDKEPIIRLCAKCNQKLANRPYFITYTGCKRVLSMSTTAQTSTESKERRLKNYLREQVEDGELYFKGKFISDDVGMSPKEIGALMVKLSDSDGDLEVEKWSYTSATTWRVQSA